MVSPSGTAAPVGDLPGWRQIFVDDFNGSALSNSWGVYHGQPAGDPASWWSPTRVSVANSELVLASYRDKNGMITGGVSNHTVAQTYGKWEMRVRVDASDEIPYALLLWPSGGSWPPEIDFLEDVGGPRTSASAFLHYVPAGGGRSMVARSVTADFTKWHTVGVEWLPGSLVYTLDGNAWATVTGPIVPDQPMWLAIQAQAGGCARRIAAQLSPCPIAGSPDRSNIEIDWVSVWAPVPVK